MSVVKASFSALAIEETGGPFGHLSGAGNERQATAVVRSRQHRKPPPIEGKCTRAAWEAAAGRGLMPHTFLTSERRHKLWSGPPGPRPTPSSACLSCRKALIHRTQGRVRGTRGPGGPPHYLCRIP